MNEPDTPTRARNPHAIAASKRFVATSETPTLPAPDDALRQRKYRKLVRRHFDKLLDKLFAEFTGLHFHVSWSPLPPQAWGTQTLPTGCSVCCRLSGSPLRPRCRTCGPQQLERALRSDGNGHRFTCGLGVRNFWFPIRIREEVIGVAYLQALHHAAQRLRSRKRARSAGAVVLSRSAFDRAARLLHLFVQHVQIASLSELRKADLTSAGRVVRALEREQSRLHDALERHLPAPPLVAHRTRPESHAEQIVRKLMERIAQDFGKPTTLQQYAASLGMNATYLSALFSKTVGRPFKTYLTELRMEQAKGLLTDPTKTISEVAFAVGYASENRFRIAFRTLTGLAPKAWRESLRLQ